MSRLKKLMIDTVLSQLVAQRVTSVKEICDITGRGDSTVYRWLSGQSEPEFSEMVALMRSVSSPEVRRALVDTFTKELPVRVEWLNDDATLHRDADTKARHDAMDLAVLAMASLVRVLVQQRPTLHGGQLDQTGREETIELIDAAMTHLGNCKVVMQGQLPAYSGRRKAKPLPRRHDG